MLNSSFGRRAALLLLCCPMAMGVLGASCNVALPGVIVDDGPDVVVPVDDFVTIELVNETGYDVDPGLFVLDSFIDTDILAPGDVLSYDIDCFADDVFGVDGLLLLDPDTAVASVNVPQVEEGIDFLCGDIITFFFTQDVDGTFFVDVAVNDVLLQ